MKSKDLQKVVKIKYENGNEPAKIHCDLGGVLSKRTINHMNKNDKQHRPYRTLPAVHSQFVQKPISQKQNDVSITINEYQQED